MSAGIQLKITTKGFPEGEAAIRQIMLKGRTLRVPFEAAGRYLIAETRGRFDRERSPEGEPWKALSARYVARSRKQGGRGGEAHPILFYPRHGWLRASINYQAGDLELAVGTNRKFLGGTKSAAAIHQLGGKAGRGAMIPARPFLGVTEADERRIGELMIEYLGKL